KRKCDFSDGLGFYLTNSTSSGDEFSIDWAKKNEACAIVMFNIHEDCLSKYQCLDLSFEEQESDLKKVNNHFRANERLSKNLRKICKNCDYIKGPISQVDSLGRR
ncbi:hypothetical protein, partial [Salmonella sp. s54412]|uniref:hypothetical protein n=1 Tax=Salmonella sp. s54412 TaxID=3160128 RepID=UPI0037548EC5